MASFSRAMRASRDVLDRCHSEADGLTAAEYDELLQERASVLRNARAWRPRHELTQRRTMLMPRMRTFGCVQNGQHGRGGVTASERRRRDGMIVADRARGLTWPQLADRHGVSERTARRAVEVWYRRQPAMLDVDPDQVVRETLASLEQSIGDYALLSMTAKGEAIRLGAMKARDDALGHRILLLRSIGRLPKDWQAWSSHRDTVELLERFHDVLRRHGVDDAVLEEFRRVINDA